MSVKKRLQSSTFDISPRGLPRITQGYNILVNLSLKQQPTKLSRVYSSQKRATRKISNAPRGFTHGV